MKKEDISKIDTKEEVMAYAIRSFKEMLHHKKVFNRLIVFMLALAVVGGVVVAVYKLWN